MSDNSSRTLVELFARRLAESADRVALHSLANGRFVTRTWREIAVDVARWTSALASMGVKPGDRVIQIAENRYEWIVAELAIHLAGGVHVAVHATLSGPQMAFQILDTNARVVLLSGSAAAEALSQAQADWPGDVQFFSYEPVQTAIGGRRVDWWNDVVRGAGQVAPVTVGRTVGTAHPTLAAAVKRTKPDDLATILYSSGTTGEPKGVVLSHGNLASNAIATDLLFLPGESDIKLCWLPLSHIFARTCDLYCWIVRGSELALAESRDTILANCQQFRPTLINGVPYFFDKVHRHIASQGGSDDEQRERLHAAFGRQLQIACSGGAPLADATAEFYQRHGIPLVQGYGLTESSPVISVSTPRAYKTGSVGRPLEGVEVKIAPDGEILTRGPHVMLGYWKQPQATADTIDAEGWLCTGDMGHVDEDGFLWITGRKKELIVTAGGKNIAPAYLERLLAEDPLILQALIVGDRRNYLAALLVPNLDTLQSEITAQGTTVASREELLVHPDVLRLIRARIEARLSVVAHCEQIGRFTLLGRGFTVEHDELTPTLKLRRSVIQQHFAREIEAMYADEGAPIL
ncbi:MAG: AMP-dependent synthetase/ligase [Pirellulales bacterium]